MMFNSDMSFDEPLQCEQEQDTRIKRVVCSGGGAKGVVYPGSYKAMEETGLLKGVQELAGSSAGAITVALMAVGMSTANFRHELLTTNLEQLMGYKVGAVFGKNAAGVCFMTKDGKPLEEFIRQHIIDAVRASLSGLAQVDKVASDHLELGALLTKMKEQHPRFTFGDLALLHQFFPEIFKRLVVPAVKFPDGDLQIFNAELTPDVEIALACRASASIPIILKPVEIDMGGEKIKFVDGGFFDNVPTDYFDIDPLGKFTKNKKPTQTMVFAFGEGLDNKKNKVFQAIYGGRWDEVISEEFLGKLFDSVIKLAKKLIDQGNPLSTPNEEIPLLIYAVKCSIEQQIEDGKMVADASIAIMRAMKKAIEYMALTPHGYQEFLHIYKQEKSEETRNALVGQFIKNKMKPVLSGSSVVNKWICNVLVGVLSNLNTPYLHTEKCEEGYQKLRTEYPLRTVELRVGTLKMTDFSDATKWAREMDALGYLDTMNYITNHELHDQKIFNPDAFYISLVNHFLHIYQAVLAGAGQDPKFNRLMKDIESLRKELIRLHKEEGVICRQVYQLIKDRVEGRLYSIEAFALSRAVEFHNQMLKADDLFKETYLQGFKKSNAFSRSEVTGERFFRAYPLHGSLKERSMFELYRDKSCHHEKTRTERVFNTLRNIDSFQETYESCLQRENSLCVELKP